LWRHRAQDAISAEKDAAIAELEAELAKFLS
jgi:hypothetical protein